MVMRLERAVLHFQLQAVHNVLDEALSSRPPERVLRDVVDPLLRRLRARGDPGATRFATSLIEVRLLFHARGWESIDGPLAVLACAPREEYVLGLIGLGLALAQRRCRVSYLGAATPAAALAQTAREQSSAIVVVSAESVDLEARERAALRLLALDRVVVTAGGAGTALAREIGGRPLPEDVLTAAARAAGIARHESPRQDDDRSPAGP
jgi:hypothetical protein